MIQECRPIVKKMYNINKMDKAAKARKTPLKEYVRQRFNELTAAVSTETGTSIMPFTDGDKDDQVSRSFFDGPGHYIRNLTL